jgi:hypothetical protein
MGLIFGLRGCSLMAPTTSNWTRREVKDPKNRFLKCNKRISGNPIGKQKRATGTLRILIRVRTENRIHAPKDQTGNIGAPNVDNIGREISIGGRSVSIRKGGVAEIIGVT